MNGWLENMDWVGLIFLGLILFCILSCWRGARHGRGSWCGGWCCGWRGEEPRRGEGRHDRA